MKKILSILLMALAVISANAQYKVGDYFEKDGLKGLVVRVNETGSHGLIMSLEKCAKKWINDGDEKFSTNAYFEDDGEKNMAVIPVGLHMASHRMLTHIRMGTATITL